MNKRAFSCLALSLFIFGCAGMSTQDNRNFHDEIAKLISVDMPLSTATKRLADSGFSCDGKIASPEISCTRTKPVALYSCLERVNIAVDLDTTAIARITPKDIVCAGF